MKAKVTGKLLLKGMAIGIADLIPGVSGGTVALVLGVYERLIKGIRNIGHRSFCNTILRRGKRCDRIDLEFLLPLFAGIGFSFVTLSFAMLYLLGNLASPTYAFFFVAILGSSLILFKSERLFSAKNMGVATLGFVLAFYLVGLNPASLGHTLPILFITGALVIMAMILPGISGALVLLFLGQYEYFFDALHELRIPELLAFAAGATLGILAFSHALSALLERHRAITISFLIGLTLGALRLCAENIRIDSASVFPVFMAALAGFFALFALEAHKVLPARRKSG
jgi:putative membrane protein